MQPLILPILIWIISLILTFDISWGQSFAVKIKNSLFNPMPFRQPVVFTPFDIKAGYLYYGGENYSSGFPYNLSAITANDLPVLLDSTQYDFNIIDNITKRRLFFVEIDILRTNITHFIYHQNYVDLQMGLGIQMINFPPDLALPSVTGKEWMYTSKKGDYYFHPQSLGLNLNTSLGWQLSRRRFTYFYHSLGISTVSLYESEGGKRSLSGTGLNESFGLGTKFILNQERADYNYTWGIEIKWSRLYMSSVDAPDGLSPIKGIDIRASGIFLTYGAQFGGNKTDGDIAYSQMKQNDFMSASESFKKFLEIEQRHIKRGKAIEMLQHCLTQIPYQKFKLAKDAYSRSDFDDAIAWYDSAESDANETLKEEILVHRQKNASELFDIIENSNNQMSFDDAKKLAKLAIEFSPEPIRYLKIMTDLNMDKAKLNLSIKNYSDAIANYQQALDLSPEMEPVIFAKLHNVTNSIIKDAYFSYKKNEKFLVLNFLKDITQINPQMANELDPYIIKLETQIKESDKITSNKNLQQFIIDKKHESLSIYSQGLQLGMTEKKVAMILGEPKHKDQHIENNLQFEMWTYPKNADISFLYFQNKMLTRIEK